VGLLKAFGNLPTSAAVAALTKIIIAAPTLVNNNIFLLNLN
jgi:hypothetical protein